MLFIYMKNFIVLVLLCVLLLACNHTTKTQENAPVYLNNRAPLQAKPYIELPLGTIKPHGWMKDQLQRMANGLTGNLDSIYPSVMGPRNGWLGGDGDGWERGPYWIDGLLPLANILNDDDLKAKVQPWIEWTLKNQRADGYIGPLPFEEKPEYEPGLQRGNRTDWWPKMVMLKVLRQYYDATGDERVIKVMTNYFKYQLKELPNRPLDAATFWAGRRGADNLLIVYWLYNITGEVFLLELGDLIYEQSYPWQTIFQNNYKEQDSIKPYSFFKMKSYPYDSTEINNMHVSQLGSIHTVNLAEGLKQPIVRFQKEANEQLLEATKIALRDIKKFHGQPNGLYGGDEPLHGNAPTQGIEFCTISESMFSLETNLQITGDGEYAELLERIAYNALPTQADDNFMSRQYFQAANQVALTDQINTSYESVNHKHTDFVYGLLTGYPCCTANMHQSWPKFVQNLFYATQDNGVAALLYAPSEVTLKVAGQVDLTLTETTTYPFKDEVLFTMKLSESANFPFHLRIPQWAVAPIITVNDTVVPFTTNKDIAILSRTWHDGDRILLKLPMQVEVTRWFQDAATIERGPLVYALKIEEERRSKNRNDRYGTFTEVLPRSDWNYALQQQTLSNINDRIKIKENSWEGTYPWSLDNSPITLTIEAIKFPEWQLVNDAPLFPDSPSIQGLDIKESNEIELIPYGCTTLRITEFPVVSAAN